jgi:hypothetical protein
LQYKTVSTYDAITKSINPNKTILINKKGVSAILDMYATIAPNNVIKINVLTPANSFNPVCCWSISLSIPINAPSAIAIRKLSITSNETNPGKKLI